MDGLTFIAEIVRALAWPLTAVVSVALLRRSLLKLIPGMSRFKYKDFEIEFEKKLEAAKAEVIDVLPAPTPSQLPPGTAEKVAEARVGPTPSRSTADLPGMVQAVEQISAVSPRAGIAEAWRFVEAAIERALSRRGVVRPRSPRDLRRVLHAQEVLPERMGALMDDLRGMRNQAVHHSDIELTPGQARDYAILAATLIAQIDPDVIPLEQ